MNPDSSEGGIFGLSHGTCFIDNCLGFAVVAVLLWYYWCVQNVPRFVFFFRFLDMKHTPHTACGMYWSAVPPLNSLLPGSSFENKLLLPGTVICCMKTSPLSNDYRYLTLSSIVHCVLSAVPVPPLNVTAAFTRCPQTDVYSSQ